MVERGQQQGKETLALRSLQRHKNVLEAFMAYAHRQGLVEREAREITEGWRMPRKRVAAHQERSKWQPDQLQALFALPIWRGCKSEVRQEEPGERIIRNWKFWLPLLGLYQGARLEELCQLRAGDVREIGGMWCLDINDRGDKKLKNPQSVRLLPLHPEIARLGFVAHVREVARTPEDRVFPTLTATGPDDKLSYYPTRWFGTLRKRLGTPSGVDFHSFRHNVTSGLLNTGVQLPAVSRMLGRTTEGGGECQEFRVLPVMMGKKELPQGPTERSADTRRDTGPTVVPDGRQCGL